MTRRSSGSLALGGILALALACRPFCGALFVQFARRLRLEIRTRGRISTPTVFTTGTSINAVVCRRVITVILSCTLRSQQKVRRNLLIDPWARDDSDTKVVTRWCHINIAGHPTGEDAPLVDGNRIASAHPCGFGSG